MAGVHWSLYTILIKQKLQETEARPPFLISKQQNAHKIK